MDDVDLAAHDRLEAGARARLVELHRAEHVAVVGDRHRGHTELAGAPDEVV